MYVCITSTYLAIKTKLINAEDTQKNKNKENKNLNNKISLTGGGSLVAIEGINPIRRTLVRTPLATRIWVIAFDSFECSGEGLSVGCTSTRRLGLCL